MLVKPNPKLRRGEEAAMGPSLLVWSFCFINLLAGLSPVWALWQGIFSNLQGNLNSWRGITWVLFL